MVAIGIDLGTTNCCVAYVKEDTPIIIPNQNGDYITPSYISFIKKEILFGKTAKNRRVQHEKNTIYDVKRFIGRAYSDPNVKKFIDNWKFNLIENNGQVEVSVCTDAVAKVYTPEMLSGLLLKHLKKQTEQYINATVDKAYITVPTYFTDAQRQATIDAGKIACFKEVRLLNEPTAAAIAYSAEHYSRGEHTIFVFDFGGGTFDVSLIKFKNKNVDVIAIDGDVELGGNDVTQNLVKHYAKVISDQYNFDVFKDARKYYRFEALCEDVKHQLSDSIEATLQILDLLSQDVEITITREEFEKINEAILVKTIEIVDRCLKRSGVDIASIDDVVVVGGSTRIKKITQSLENYFKKPLRHTINADQAVAIGAAIAASKWDGNASFTDVIFKDICPYSLGVEILGKFMSVIIPKYSPIPAKFTEDYFNCFDMQTVLRVNIYSGEHRKTKKNNKLAQLNISGFQPGPANSVKIDVTFMYDINGILSVEVDEAATGKKNLTICLDKGRLSEIDLQEQVDTIEEVYNEFESMTAFKVLRQKVLDMCNTPEMKRIAGGFCESTETFVKSLTHSQENFKQLEERYNKFLKLR